MSDVWPDEHAPDAPAWRELLHKAYTDGGEPDDPFGLYGALKAMRLSGAMVRFANSRASIKPHPDADPGEYAYLRETYLKPHAALLTRLLGELVEPARLVVPAIVTEEPAPEPVPVPSYEQVPLDWQVGGYLDGRG